MATNVKNVKNANVNAGVNVDEEVVNNEVVNNEEQETNETNNSGFKSFKQIVKELISAGNKRVNNIRVRSAKVTPMDNYVRVSLTLDNAVDGYLSNEDGVYEKGMTNIIFASTYSIGSLLKEYDETAWCANQLIQNIKGFEVILAGAKIDIIQEEVSGDENYKNPFSNTNDEGVFLGHDTIINHIVNIKLGNQAQKMLDMMAMKMMMGSMGF